VRVTSRTEIRIQLTPSLHGSDGGEGAVAGMTRARPTLSAATSHDWRVTHIARGLMGYDLRHNMLRPNRRAAPGAAWVRRQVAGPACMAREQPLFIAFGAMDCQA
jgi:hypothetical protein